MIRHARLAAAALVATLIGASALAHDEYRVIGTITEQKGDALVVKAQDGRIANIRVNEKTELSKETGTATKADLKVGRFVVIQAYGDDYSDMLALEIKLVPAPAGKPAK
jgi:hypothetical protein